MARRRRNSIACYVWLFVHGDFHVFLPSVAKSTFYDLLQILTNLAISFNYILHQFLPKEELHSTRLR